MKRLTSSLALIATASVAAADAPGLKISTLDLPHHDGSARVATWYPSVDAASSELYAGNPVFVGVEAAPDAPIAAGTFPVVLFSHGMGGTDRAQAWLGAALAERGAIVVIVNHPNSTWGDFNMSQGVNHWTRAQDVSTALDALLSDPELSDSVDTSRIMAAGFSFGGWTALSLGGMTGNHAGIVDACTTHIDKMEACDMLLSDAVSMQTIDADLWNANYADPRVTSVTAIDPGFVWGLEAADVAGFTPQSTIIALGGTGNQMMATDFDQSGLSDLLSGSQILRFDPAYHFSAMPLCTPAGEAILKEENDDPVCTDPVGSDRAAIHDAIIAQIAEDLGL